jgi:hypothetical protein
MWSNEIENHDFRNLFNIFFRLNVKTTVTKNDADKVENLNIGDLVLKRKVNSISMVFECVYSAEFSLNEVEFDVKKVNCSFNYPKSFYNTINI